jgi:ABC-type transport system involved in Fe-S cluster assembly fused permease/ATPase subunit
MTGRTSILITHDLPVAAEADLILLLADGRIVDQGTHKELLARSGQYRDLWEFKSSHPGDSATSIEIKTVN